MNKVLKIRFTFVVLFHVSCVAKPVHAGVRNYSLSGNISSKRGRFGGKECDEFLKVVLTLVTFVMSGGVTCSLTKV